MKTEHYAHIEEMYHISAFSHMNVPNDCDQIINIEDLRIYLRSSGSYNISARDYNLILNIPTEELAIEILQHIKDTELLFV